MVRYWRWAVIVVLLVALAGSAWGPLDGWINEAAMGRIAQNNDAYLEKSFANAEQLFLVLTAIKTVLAVIEGSGVGVGFNLQVGDIVQAVYDYIDFAWMVILLSALVIKLTQMLLLAASWADSPLLTMTLAVLLVYFSVKWGFKAQWARNLRRVLRDLSYFLVTITLAAYLLLPLSVAVGARLSAEITDSHKQTASVELLALEAELDARKAAIAETEGIFSKAGKMGEAVMAMGNYLAARTADLFWQVISLCAAYIFDTVVFPLALFVLLFWLVRLLARYFFGLRQQKAFREDLAALLEQYMGAGRGIAPGAERLLGRGQVGGTRSTGQEGGTRPERSGDV